MNETTTSLRDKISSLQPKHWGLIGLGVIILFAISNSGGEDVDPESWDCESIKDAVIATSQGEDLEIVEIGDVITQSKHSTYIRCIASGRWKHGGGMIGYGAEVSDQGNVIISINRE